MPVNVCMHGHGAFIFRQVTEKAYRETHAHDVGAAQVGSCANQTIA